MAVKWITSGHDLFIFHKRKWSKGMAGVYSATGAYNGEIAGVTESVEVMEPEEVRGEMKRIVREISKQYNFTKKQNYE